VEAGTLSPRAERDSKRGQRPLRSKRLLALAGDERLVEQIRRGNELAFEVAFERHVAGILAFCRHMLGSREEAEDAVQHTFAAAYGDLQRGHQRRISLKPWLYTIARNRCVSMLRVRREHATELYDLPTEGLSEEVERRAELRELLADVRELPEDQRAALLLAEAAGLSHAEVAQVLGCEAGSVKGIVFRARTGLMERRTARETPCDEIREQLANLRGGALRRNELRHHLRGCPACTAYRDDVRRQRQMLAVALPVAPSLGLKSSVLGAVGLTGGAVGGAAAGGVALGSATVAKVALVGVLAGGSVVAGEVVVHNVTDQNGAQVAPAPDRARGDNGAPPAADVPVGTRGAHGELIRSDRSQGLRGDEGRTARSQGDGYAGSKASETRPERTSSAGGRRLGQEKGAERVAPTRPDHARRQGSTERTAPARELPARPETRLRPSPQTKAVPPATVDETAPAVAVPEAQADSSHDPVAPDPPEQPQ
jgi:RNA polymerase sigma factor (sigma-70 family)